MPAPPYLPQELVDSIIDYVDADNPALLSCALVSRLWLHSSRRHLFANISLSPHSSGKSPPQLLCQRLYRVLQESPAIIPYVRHLHVVDGGSSPNVPTRQWITSERTLPPLLKLLTHLRQLELGASSSSSPLQWKSLPFILQNAVCTILKLPTLSFVRIHTWTFPNLVSLAAVISSCQNLKGLSLSSVTVDEELDPYPHHSETSGISISSPPQLPLLVSSDRGRNRRQVDTAEGLGIHTEDDTISDSNDTRASDIFDSSVSADDDTVNTRGSIPQPHLEALSLDYVNFGYLGYWLFAPSQSPSPINFANLRELRISRSADPLVVEQILISIGTSLEYLHLKPGTWDVFAFDLRRNSNLKSLRLTLENSETALSWCTTLLSSLAPYGFISSSSSSSSASMSRPSSYLDDGDDEDDELQLTHISLEFWTDLKKLSSSSSTSSSTTSSSLSNSPNQSSSSLLPSFSLPSSISSSPLPTSSSTLPSASSPSSPSLLSSSSSSSSSSPSISTSTSTSIDHHHHHHHHHTNHRQARRRKSLFLSSLSPTWNSLDSLLSILPTPLQQVDVGLFANSSSQDFVRVKGMLRGVRERMVRCGCHDDNNNNGGGDCVGGGGGLEGEMCSDSKEKDKDKEREKEKDGYKSDNDVDGSGRIRDCGCGVVRVYQLGLKSQRSIGRICGPRLRSFEGIN